MLELVGLRNSRKSKGASKESIRKLNKKVGIINKLISVKEKKLDCERHLHIEVSSRRALSTNCRVNNKNWRCTTWYNWQCYLFNMSGNIEGLLAIRNVRKKHSQPRYILKKEINDILIFHSVNIDNLKLVNNTILRYVL